MASIVDFFNLLFFLKPTKSNKKCIKDVDQGPVVKAGLALNLGSNLTR
jgi:hypothetical protein